MSRFRKAVLIGALAAACGTVWAQKLPPGLGRVATPDEVKAWDIDVRPDFKGLPPGSGSVAKGMEVWEGKCASCHGVFGESNEVFTPIVGGTTAEDIKTGRVKGLVHGEGRTTLMKVATLSTLWDYINRAMPWNAPKSLTTEEVYAVVAYILHLGDIVPDNFVLSDQNIRDVQNRMPNRNGMTTNHGMWLPNGKPDVRNTACMKNCEVDVAKVSSHLPDFARDAHGNLIEQNRPVGPVRGIDVTKPPGARPSSAAPAPAVVAAAPAAATVSGLELAKAQGCTACHGVNNKIVGPGFSEIAAKYRGRADAEAYLAGKVRAGGSGVWGAVPMPPQAQLKDDEVNALAKWIAGGAK
ncbi:c-type cytochrome [Azohydromonas sediminis]|uniref:c-type cytochrome n=1 Tax=Azohydromonas sediminis TaxID=2259674 RepID=UPI000E657CC8|nr:c-type cytochrome [Azohydromonas sediminis]